MSVNVDLRGYSEEEIEGEIEGEQKRETQELLQFFLARYRLYHQSFIGLSLVFKSDEEGPWTLDIRYKNGRMALEFEEAPGGEDTYIHPSILPVIET